MDVFLAAKWRLEARVAMQWWEQDRLDLEGIRNSAREEEQMEGGVGEGRERDRYEFCGRMF